MSENIADVVASDVLKEWCNEAMRVEDVLAVLDEFKGRDVCISGRDFNVKIMSVDADVENYSLSVFLEAYCPQHPNIRHAKTFVWNPSDKYAGEFLYKSLLNMTTPFREIHPKHS